MSPHGQVQTTDGYCTNHRPSIPDLLIVATATEDVAGQGVGRLRSSGFGAASAMWLEDDLGCGHAICSDLFERLLSVSEWA